MAFPTTNLSILAEAYINSQWRDIAGGIRYANGIRIDQGRGAEGTVATHTRCDFELDNRAPHPYSPNNPAGTYYGHLGKNIPVRIGIKALADAFGDAVSNGWGTADTGQAWSNGGAGGVVANS